MCHRVKKSNFGVVFRGQSNGDTKSPVTVQISWLQFHGVDLNWHQFCLSVSWFVQLHSWFDLITGLTLKNYPNLTFDCPNPSSGSKDTVIMILKSADLYSHRWFSVTIRLASKNYPKMTLWLSKSVQWIKRYSDNDFEVSWFVQLNSWLDITKWLTIENQTKITISVWKACI